MGTMNIDVAALAAKAMNLNGFGYDEGFLKLYSRPSRVLTDFSAYSLSKCPAPIPSRLILYLDMPGFLKMTEMCCAWISTPASRRRSTLTVP